MFVTRSSLIKNHEETAVSSNASVVECEAKNTDGRRPFRGMSFWFVERKVAVLSFDLQMLLKHLGVI